MTLIKKNFPGWTNLTDFFDDDWLRGRFNSTDLMPAINVIENTNNFEIEVAAPGFKKEDFKVSIENGLLSVIAKTEKEEEEKKKNYTRKEFSSKSFKRSFTLPENVEKEDLKAKYSDGVLRMTLKKSTKEIPAKKLVSIE